MRTIVASPEKLQRLDSLLCRTDSSRFAMSVTHIWIFMALALSPQKYLSGKFCFICLKSDSICHLRRYIATIVSRVISKSLVRSDISLGFLPFFISTYVIILAIWPKTCTSIKNLHRHLRPTSLSELTSDTLCETLPVVLSRCTSINAYATSGSNLQFFKF